MQIGSKPDGGCAVTAVNHGDRSCRRSPVLAIRGLRRLGELQRHLVASILPTRSITSDEPGGHLVTIVTALDAWVIYSPGPQADTNQAVPASG
jgi:hypothetical protein